MLNPELQHDIDIEIDKANYELRTFIRSPYFKDTLELLYRVHHVDNIDNQEALELEVLLYLLNISEYNDIKEAIMSEVYNNDIRYNSDLESLVKDINIYLINKSNEDNDISSIYKRKPDEYKDENIHQEIKNYLDLQEDTPDPFDPYTNRVETLPEHYKDRDNIRVEEKEVDDITHITDKYREKIDKNDL